MGAEYQRVKAVNIQFGWRQSTTSRFVWGFSVRPLGFSWAERKRKPDPTSIKADEKTPTASAIGVFFFEAWR
ncbi:MAG: hypothetical protein DBW90_02125 [Halieaceae bacterium]|jgi:hypothetical protein|nr:MAG: hypothetical protein DBW90_02125 [Halieaceae bacterium]